MVELELENLILHYSHTNRAEGKSPRTVEWYTEMLKYYIRFLKSQGKQSVLGELSASNVREFIVREQGKGMSPYTVQAKVRALKTFSSWLLSESYTSTNLLSTVKLPKVPIKMVEPLTPEEISKLVDYQNPLTNTGSRDIAILYTFLDSGIRCSELCNLRLEDSHIEEGYLKVNGKGNKERVVPIGSMTKKAILHYFHHFRPEPVSDLDDYLFLTNDGRQLQKNNIRLMFNRWGKKAEVPRIHPHLCRHTFATNFLRERCGDVFMLKQILGHTTLEMVNRYVHYASCDDLMQGRLPSPLDRISSRDLRTSKTNRLLNNSKRVKRS